MPDYRRGQRKREGYKPGTREVEAKKNVITPGERSWWERVKPGESMTAAAMRELERMNGSKEAKRIVPRVIE